MAITNNSVAFMAAQLAATLATGGAVGAGDSTTAFDVAQTDLQATTNKLRKAMDSGFPTVSGSVITCQATFLTTEANFAWNEWGIFVSGSGGTMINRKVESLGNKNASQSWQMVVTLTLST
jgi:hypothetical protein